MLIECLTMREGITVVSIKGHNYEFMPIPGSMDGEVTTSVANIADQEAVDYLIGNETKNMKGRGNFRMYRPKQAQDELLVRRKDRESKLGRLQGYSIKVLNLMGNDKGYMIAKESAGKPMEFCGMNGAWTTDVQRIWPFPKLSDADTWLRSMVAGDPLPIIDVTKPYICQEPECTEVFATAKELSAHWDAVHANASTQQEDVKAGIANLLKEKSESKHYAQTPKG